MVVLMLGCSNMRYLSFIALFIIILCNQTALALAPATKMLSQAEQTRSTAAGSELPEVIDQSVLEEMKVFIRQKYEDISDFCIPSKKLINDLRFALQDEDTPNVFSKELINVINNYKILDIYINALIDEGTVDEYVESYVAHYGVTRRGIGLSHEAFDKARGVIAQSNKYLVFGDLNKVGQGDSYNGSFFQRAVPERRSSAHDMRGDLMASMLGIDSEGVNRRDCTGTGVFRKALQILTERSKLVSLHESLQRLTVVAVSDKTPEQIIGAASRANGASGQNSAVEPQNIGRDLLVARDYGHFCATYFDRGNNTLYVPAGLLWRAMQDTNLLVLLLAQTEVVNPEHCYKIKKLFHLNAFLTASPYRHWRMKLGVTNFFDYLVYLFGEDIPPWRRRIVDGYQQAYDRWVETGVSRAYRVYEELYEWHRGVRDVESLKFYLRRKKLLARKKDRCGEQMAFIDHVCGKIDDGIVCVLLNQSLLHWCTVEKIQDIDAKYLRFMLTFFHIFSGVFRSVSEEDMRFYKEKLPEMYRDDNEPFKSFVYYFKQFGMSSGNLIDPKFILSMAEVFREDYGYLFRPSSKLEGVDPKQLIDDFIQVHGFSSFYKLTVHTGVRVKNMVLFQRDEFDSHVQHFGLESVLSLAEVAGEDFRFYLRYLDRCTDWIDDIGYDVFLDLVRYFGEDFRLLLNIYGRNKPIFLEEAGIIGPERVTGKAHRFWLVDLKTPLSQCGTIASKKKLLRSLAKSLRRMSRDQKVDFYREKAAQRNRQQDRASETSL